MSRRARALLWIVAAPLPNATDCFAHCRVVAMFPIFLQLGTVIALAPAQKNLNTLGERRK